ncbi:MAG: hypothetical protein EXR72_02770 [Myxococcales bacterium]|nr:hypothetical protein [Myxococcales bacterium]
MRRFPALLAALLLASCGGASVPPGASDLGVSVGDGAPLPGSDLAVPPGSDLAMAVTEVLTLGIGPIPLDAGKEKTVCTRFKLPTTTAIDVIRLDATLAPGSHHLIFFKSKEATEKKEVYECQPLDIAGGDIPIYIAESQDNNALPLPSGAAYHFEAGDMVKIEAHYINSTAKAIVGQGDIRLTVGKAAAYEKADIMFCGSVSPLDKMFGGKGVPPGATTLPPAFFKMPPGIKMFGLTTHQHKRGTLMTIDKSSSAAAGTNLTMGQPYDNPPFVTWDDAHLQTFAAGEGLRWQCHYQNNGQKTYMFGQSAEDNEMCFLWAYYYPSVGRFISFADCFR